ncbi:unnamed protein product [Rotaria sp. Silwood2]|nr:unnamed protein product [Rotaria sp. Silwood2]CAF4471872.1 unnamed protein product [Rotaria sp. Silwood2]
MGVGSSQESQSSSRHSSTSGRRLRRFFFRRNKPIPTTQLSSPGITQPTSYQHFYGTRPSSRPIPIYPPLEQPSPSFLPISYNNFQFPSYIPPQPMMMPPPPPPRVAPFMSPSYMIPAPPPFLPPMSTPYMQQPQVQPIYNNMVAPVSMPVGNSGGALLNPPSYPGAPSRLITDWTGGGAISPGFLGPPI